MSHTSTEENRGAMDHPIKVLLANRPRALRTRLEELLQHRSDVEVVGIAPDRVKLLIAVEDTKADVVIVTLPSSEKMPGICSHLLYEYPQLLILALSSDGTKARIYRQAIAVEQLSDTSDEGILLAIRQAKADSTS